MEKNKTHIQLTPEHRGKGSTLFTGRPEGRSVRVELGLDKKDDSNESYIVYIPSGTTSFNASFFLGLFYKSIQKLGSIEAFKKKYKIDLSQLEPSLQPIIERNLVECYRKAENELNNSTGLD